MQFFFFDIFEQFLFKNLHHFLSATQKYMQYFFTALFIKRIASRGSYGEPNFPVVYMGKLTDHMKTLVIYTTLAGLLWCIHMIDINKMDLNFQLSMHCGTISTKSSAFCTRKKKLNFVMWHFYFIDSCIQIGECSSVSGLFLASVSEPFMEEKSTNGC